MRLLNTKSFELQEFSDQNIPPYAILSHRWGADELSLQDFEAGRKRDGAGYAKILRACRQAWFVECKYYPIDRSSPNQDHIGLNWIWIDTCCIDKTSSTELSEAINSMYQWYAGSEVCIVYLPDVATFIDGKYLDKDSVLKSFRKSTWFQRGWTLQELLAPEVLVFWDCDWRRVGTKHDLLDSIVLATKIPRRALELPEYPRLLWSLRTSRQRIQGYSVAQKMSWAARRTTTRVEDLAYCLLGIFQINMPLLYGERHAAFRRLQLEILKTSEDESIFAWERDIEASTSLSTPWSFHGILASGPLLFAGCQDVQTHPFVKRKPFNVTNRGLHFQVHCTHRFRRPLYTPKREAKEFRFTAFPLNCTSNPDEPLPLMPELALPAIRPGGKAVAVWSMKRCVHEPTQTKRWQFRPFIQRKWIYIQL